MTTVSIKWYHGGITRRFGLACKSDDDHYRALMDRITKLQPDFSNKLFWKDACGDEIELSSSEEMIEAIRNMTDDIPLVIYTKEANDKKKPHLPLPSSSNNKERISTSLAKTGDPVEYSEQRIRRLFTLLNTKNPSEESIVEDPSNQVEQWHQLSESVDCSKTSIYRKTLQTIDGVKVLMKSETIDRSESFDEARPHRRIVCDKCQLEIHGPRYRCKTRPGQYRCEHCVMTRDSHLDRRGSCGSVGSGNGRKHSVWECVAHHILDLSEKM